MKHVSTDVLRYSLARKSSTTVRRHYLNWRAENSIPMRCDNEACVFYKQTLCWNNKSLPLILDHANGNNSDNRPENLRLLCPNCDSQLVVTKGGANKGRVEKSEGGFAIVSKTTGTRNCVMPCDTASIAVSLTSTELLLAKKADSK